MFKLIAVLAQKHGYKRQFQCEKSPPPPKKFEGSEANKSFRINKSMPRIAKTEPN